MFPSTVTEGLCDGPVYDPLPVPVHPVNVQVYAEFPPPAAALSGTEVPADFEYVPDPGDVRFSCAHAEGDAPTVIE